jgi:hypothetical protein
MEHAVADFLNVGVVLEVEKAKRRFLNPQLNPNSRALVCLALSQCCAKPAAQKGVLGRAGGHFESRPGVT